MSKEEINGFLVDKFNQHGLKEGASQGICPLCSSDRKPKNAKALSNLATQNPELYKIYQSGKPTALTEYYKAVYKDNPKLYEQKLSRFKLWSKYFN